MAQPVARRDATSAPTEIGLLAYEKVPAG